MSMTETATPPVPKQKRHKRPNRKRAAAPVIEKKPPPEFEGISPTDCCNDCKPERCVITGIGICGHPMKGGLQSALMVKDEVMKRYQRAKHFLAKAKLDLTAGG